MTRLATAIGLGLISTGATITSAAYLKEHPTDILTGAVHSAESPQVLLAGYRVAAWACFACGAVGFGLACVGLRSLGVVGRKDEPKLEEAEDSSVAPGNLTRRRPRRETE